MSGYTAHDVAKMLGLPPARLRAYVRAGLLSPERGQRGELRFSFQDMLLVRTAEGLVKERIPPRRVRRTLQRLRARLPDTRPLTGLQLAAEGDDVVVRDGDTRWNADSGQVLLDLRVPVGEPAAERTPSDLSAPLTQFRLHRPQRSAPPPANDTAPTAVPTPVSVDALFALGCQTEETDPVAARNTYRQLLLLAPDHADAHVNLGRLLHEASDYGEAEQHYRRALTLRPEDPTAAFNLGVALEDQGLVAPALAAYERAIALKEDNADAHYNAARLYEKSGEYSAAVRHLRAYRRLMKNR